MASRDSANGTTESRNAKARRRPVAILVGAAGAFAAAAAMATGSAVTAAPAKADIETLLDPIIQPLMTSLSDAIAGFDPAAATDLTSWTDSLLSSLSALDVSAALPAAAEPAAASAASTSGVYDLPLTMQVVTEPTVQATIAGSPDQTLLVDTGSSGLVIPWQDLGSNNLSAFWNLLTLGSPINGIQMSGYSGGVDYLYLTYNTTVDYTTTTGTLDTTNVPVNVEVLSWPTALGSPANFQQFLADDHVTGILGIGNAGSDGGPGVSPLQSAGFSGVTVDIPHSELVVGANSGTPLFTLSGAPIPNSSLYESVNGGTPVAVSDDLDSGGVYGTIPSSLVGNAGSLPTGTVISVYDNSAGTGTPLYSYTVGTDSLGQSTAPTAVSGNQIDSGVVPFLQQPIYIGYGPGGGTLVFDKP
jgi:PE-PGRS C-terminal aspartyl peptidase-like domain